jgi:hypothetical protein
VLEELTICKFGALTQDGSNFSDMKLTISVILMLEEENVLKSNMAKMQRANQFRLALEQKKHNKDGELSMLTKQKRSQLKDLTKIGDSTSTDLSILDQDSL